MFVCPPMDVPALIQVLAGDGAAWRLIETPEGACLYRVDDQDDARLVKQWEGRKPDALLPTSEGVVAIGAHWFMHLSQDGDDGIRGRLPVPAERACEANGELRVEGGGQSWALTNHLWMGPLPEVCTPDLAQADAPPGPVGTR